MAVFLPRSLPATALLRAAGYDVAEEASADELGPRPRPINIALINLMPDKPSVEAEFARLLCDASQDIRLLLAVPDGYETTSTSGDYMETFYRSFFELPLTRIDAVIVTGAPVETLPFDEVRYWRGLVRIFDWLDAARVPAMHICWAAQAAMYHHHGVRKHRLPRKRFGLYPHVPVGSGHPILAGVDLPFFMPVSRHTETRISDLSRRPSLRPVLTAPISGIGLVQDRARPALYCLNHPEYQPHRLYDEFLRDRRAGKLIDPPVGFDPTGKHPQATWHQAAKAFYANWVAEIGAADPRNCGDVALDWLLRAEMDSMTCEASGATCPH